MKQFFVILVIVFIWSSNYAQKQPQSLGDDASTESFGIGFGLDYGGIGGRFTYLPDPHFGLFASGGSSPLQRADTKTAFGTVT